MSNFYAPNSAEANGVTTSSYTQGAASVVASCAVSGSAHYLRRGVAPVPASAVITALQTHIVSASSAAPADAFISAVGKKIHSLSAMIGGTANISAFIIAEVEGTVTFAGVAEIVAIPADFIADSGVTATADVVPTATRIRPGASAPVGTGGSTVTATGGVNTQTSVILTPATASVRAEATVNNEVDGFAFITPYADVYLDDSLYTHLLSAGQVNLTGQATINGTLIYKHVARSAVSSVSNISLLSTATLLSDTAFSGSAEVTATALRTAKSSVTVAGLASMPTIVSLQRFAGVSTVSAAASTNVDEPLRIRTASSPPHATATVGAVDGFLIKSSAAGINSTAATSLDAGETSAITQGTADFSVSAVVSATAEIIKIATADPTTASAEITSIGIRVLLPIPELADASASMVSSAIRKAEGVSTIDTTAACALDAALTRNTTQGTASLDGVVSIEAFSSTNAAILDPPERTFVRPAAQSTFIRNPYTAVFTRPGSQSTFGRAA